MVTQVNWQGAETLEECVIRYFKKLNRSAQDEADFESLKAFFGRQRVAEIWENYQMRLKESGQFGLI